MFTMKRDDIQIISKPRYILFFHLILFQNVFMRLIHLVSLLNISINTQIHVQHHHYALRNISVLTCGLENGHYLPAVSVETAGNRK